MANVSPIITKYFIKFEIWKSLSLIVCSTEADLEVRQTTA